MKLLSASLPKSVNSMLFPEPSAASASLYVFTIKRVKDPTLVNMLFVITIESRANTSSLVAGTTFDFLIPRAITECDSDSCARACAASRIHPSGNLHHHGANVAAPQCTAAHTPAPEKGLTRRCSLLTSHTPM